MNPANLRLEFKMSREVRARVLHHARRLGCRLCDIARDGTLMRLDQLDELEARQRLPILRRPVATGATTTVGDALRAKPRSTVRAGVAASFSRLADYLEQARDEADSEARAKTVVEEIEDRTSSKEEADAACAALKDFVRARQEARGE